MDIRRIRITEVRAHVLKGSLKERFGWSLNWTSSRTATVVEVRTDAGITGWGDGAYGREILSRRPEAVIGRSPFEIEGIFEELRALPRLQGRAGPPAAAGLDIALWDILGKALGVPVSQILGRRYRDRVEAYCTALYRKDWPDLAEGLAEEARGWKAQGYRAMKMKIGYGPETDVRVVRAVREAVGGEIGLGVDSNCAYDVGTATALGRRLEEFDPLWWEEPLLADDLAGYARLRESVRIPFASGESLATDELITDYIQPRLVDIVQPDLEFVGLTGGRRLSQSAWLNHVRLVPHNWGTALRTAATLHWMACCPPLSDALYTHPILFEFDRTESPIRDAIVRQKIDIDPADACVAVPGGPGLGVDVIPEAVEEFRTELVCFP